MEAIERMERPTDSTAKESSAQISYDASKNRNSSHTISSLHIGHTSLELAAVTVLPLPNCTLLPISFSASGKGLVASGLEFSESRETVLSV